MHFQEFINNYESMTPYSSANLIKIIMEYYLIDKHKYSILIDKIHSFSDIVGYDCIINIDIYSIPDKNIENKLSIYVRQCDMTNHIKKQVEKAIEFNTLFELEY